MKSIGLSFHGRKLHLFDTFCAKFPYSDANLPAHILFPSYWWNGLLTDQGHSTSFPTKKAETKRYFHCDWVILKFLQKSNLIELIQTFLQVRLPKISFSFGQSPDMCNVSQRSTFSSRPHTITLAWGVDGGWGMSPNTYGWLIPQVILLLPPDLMLSPLHLDGPHSLRAHIWLFLGNNFIKALLAILQC